MMNIFRQTRSTPDSDFYGVKLPLVIMLVALGVLVGETMPFSIF